MQLQSVTVQLCYSYASAKPGLAVQYCPTLWYYEAREKYYEQREKQIPGFADVGRLCDWTFKH